MQVRSRFSGGGDGKEDFRPFLACLSRLGFQLTRQDAGNRMFVTWVLRKEQPAGGQKSAARELQGMKWPPLKACLYKRR